MIMANDKQRLMKVKAQLKKRQPKFIRQDAHKHKRVQKVWRKPRGLHSKIRDSRKGYRAKLQEGYRTPKAVRGLDKHGLLPVLVSTTKQLEALDPKVHSLIISGTLGGRRKLEILKIAQEKSFTLVNATKDTAAKITARFKQQGADKKQREKDRDAKRKAQEEKAKKTPKADKSEKSPAAEADESSDDASADERAASESKPKKATRKKSVKKSDGDKTGEDDE
jgi:large subunit ribosomal protein L32e